MSLILLLLYAGIQKNDAQIKTKNFSKKADININNVIDIIDNNGTDLISIYSNHLGYEKINKGPLKGAEKSVFKEGIAFENGKKIEFENDETYLFSIKNSIFTEKLNLETSSKILYKYNIIHNKVNKSNSKCFIPKVTNSISLIPNSNLILVSDYYETIGDSIFIYNSDLVLIKSHKPYSNGFSRVISCEKDELLYILSVPYDDGNKKEYKVTIINPEQNSLVGEFVNIAEINPIQMIPLTNSFLVICVGKLLSIDRQGQIIWQKNLNTSLSFVVMDKEGGTFYCISDGAIVCINANNGTELWRKELEEIYPRFEKSEIRNNEYYMAYSPIDFKYLPNLNLLSLITSRGEQFINRNTIKHSDVFLSLINLNGEIIQQISLSSNLKSTATNRESKIGDKTKPYRILNNNDSGFNIIQMDKIEKYEK